MPRCLTRTFLCTEAVLCAAFLTLDVWDLPEPGVWLKYIAVLLCLLFSLLCARRGGDVLIFLALTLTAAADLFLLVEDRGYAFGVLLFLGVQFLCLIRLRLAGTPPCLLLRTVLPLLLGMLLFALDLAAPLSLLAALYFSQLLINVILARARPGLFPLGLTLLLCCDLCVGLVNTPLFPALNGLAQLGMWLFYLPSQVLMALCALPKKEGI